MLDYNPNELHLEQMQTLTYLRGRHNELTDILDLLRNTPRPTKQVTDLIDKLSLRLESYSEELS